MQHECKITVLEKKYFLSIRRSILLIRNQDLARFSRKGIHLS